MKEFIVWYSNGTDKFNKEFTLDDLISQLHYDEICDSPLLKDYKVIEICQSVGLKDINNNKIYADCSIVEFEWKISGFKKVGYFYYSNEDLCYMAKGVSEYTSDVLFYDKHTMKNFKIIDTIQENKLGLIKE